MASFTDSSTTTVIATDLSLDVLYVWCSTAKWCGSQTWCGALESIFIDLQSPE